MADPKDQLKTTFLYGCELCSTTFPVEVLGRHDPEPKLFMEHTEGCKGRPGNPGFNGMGILIGVKRQ
jgi:hypothetical protein